MATGSTDVRKLLDLIREQNCVVEESNGTVKVKIPNGEMVMFSFVSSEARSLANLKGHLKRAGIVTQASEWKRIKKARARQEAAKNHEHTWKPGAGFMVGDMSVTTTEICACGDFRDRTRDEVRVDHLIALRRLSNGRILTPDELHLRDEIAAEVDPDPTDRAIREIEDNLAINAGLLTEAQEEAADRVVYEALREEGLDPEQDSDRAMYLEQDVRMAMSQAIPTSNLEWDLPPVSVEQEIFLSEEDEIEAMIRRAKDEAA